MALNWHGLQSPTEVSRLDYRVNDHEDTEKYFAPGCTKVFRTLIKYFGFPLWIIKGLPSLECWFEYLMLNFMTKLSLHISSKNHNVISNWQCDHGQLIGGLISTFEIFTKLDKSTHVKDCSLLTRSALLIFSQQNQSFRDNIIMLFSSKA